MSDILLGHSFFLRLDQGAWGAMEPYPPLATLYAAAMLRDAGHDVAFFDAMLADSEAEWLRALERETPSVAVLFEDSFNFLTKMCLLRMREAAFAMIRAARARGCTVIACGSDATDRAEAYLEAGADFVLAGEGEATLLELLAHRARSPGLEPATVPGLVYRDRGTIRRTAPRPVLRDLDALPLPAWDLVDMERYARAWRERRGRFSLNLATSRGCPYHCEWCAKPIWGRHYHTRSPGRVVEEMLLLRERYAPDHFWFTDDILGLQPGWLDAFADGVLERGARTPFKCLCRPDLLLRDGRIDALRRAGCESVWMGAESGSQTVLDAMQKGVRVEAIQGAARALRAAGIRVGFFLQFGYVGETGADIEATLRLVRACRPDEIGVSVSYPLPGTRFHERVREQLAERENWEDTRDLAMLYHGPQSTAFYRRLHALAHRELACTHGFHELRGAVRHPHRLRPRHLRLAVTTALRLAGVAADRLRLEALARPATDARS